MGQQVNFFWHGSDERDFFEAARQRSSDLRVLRYTSATEVFTPFQELPSIDEPAGFHVWLWDQATCSPPVARWVVQQHYHTIDPSASEVIELSRSYERQGRLIRGRLWAELVRQDIASPVQRTEKSPTFQKWFKSLVGWIKRHHTRTPEGWYLGPGARTFQQEGGRLIQVDFAPVVKIVKS